MGEDASSAAMDETTEDFLSALQSPANRVLNQHDPPNHWLSNPTTLVTRSNIHSLSLGTGHSIYSSSILPAILNADREIIFVTCFWASSPSLRDLSSTLKQLSDRVLSQTRNQPPHEREKLRVRICFSSSSLWQKLSHTRSLHGQIYPSSTYVSKFGLPNPRDLQGLELTIKSIFVLPFSVMHPKFVIIDRKTVLLPSCNLSWEEWFEGCVTLTGGIVDQVYRFYQKFWAANEDYLPLDPHIIPDNLGTGNAEKNVPQPGLLTTSTLDFSGVPTVLLPSPHHSNPRFALPWQTHRSAPPTPLNIYLLALFANARQTIKIQTPNLTSPPVLTALLSALGRGVDVNILTCERLMVLEQIATALTTTSRCVQRLIRKYKNLVDKKRHITSADPEAGLISERAVGRLKISYFSPKLRSPTNPIEPVQSHFKMTIVDGRITALGSGNMDRASWYTSQELGVAFVSSELSAQVLRDRDFAMTGRSRVIFEST